jgi:16S rRNA (cytosine967-C5)-methyltransferase
MSYELYHYSFYVKVISIMNKCDLFRQHHFFNLLERYDLQKGPLDLFVHLYFRHNPQLGSKDRAYIAEKIYHYFRWKSAIDARLEGISGEERNRQMIHLLSVKEEDLCSKDPYLHVAFPRELYDDLYATYGEETPSVCRACNQMAPLTIRANLLKTTREDLRSSLEKEGIVVFVDPSAPCALKLEKRLNMSSLTSFKEGFFEMQDAGSQMAAEQVAVAEGESFLDYCAGSGGKTLAIAPKMQGKGQIFLHDIREEALYEAKKRLKRAGIQNAQLIMPSEGAKLSRLRGKMDWVLVDAPCSGTGTLRRNPDMKWKYSRETLTRLCREQRDIFDKALSFVKKKGRIVYVTCSLLKEENQDQRSYFLQKYPFLELLDEISTNPMTSTMDGLYAASFVLKNVISS